VDQEQSPSSFHQLLTHHDTRQSARSKRSNRFTDNNAGRAPYHDQQANETLKAL